MKTNENSKKKSSNDLELLTDVDLMNLFKVTPSCLYRWRCQKQLPFLKVGNSIYYVKKDIKALLKHKARMQ